MKKMLAAVFTLAITSSGILLAHFQKLVPSTEIVTASSGRKISLDILFTHPMEQGPVMEMKKPVRFGVMTGGKIIDLAKSLTQVKKQGKTAWTAQYEVKSPGDHVFYLEPAGYWEPAEEKMIIHYTKVVVNAMGLENGWDQMVGFPVEIEPLTRPYGLWTGNIFRGIVKKNGKPVPFAEIEVEYLNEGKKITPPADPFITQVIKSDQNGVFAYAMPRSGWWSFAALVDGDKKMKNPGGKEVDVELGGLIWVRTRDMK